MENQPQNILQESQSGNEIISENQQSPSIELLLENQPATSSEIVLENLSSTVIEPNISIEDPLSTILLLINSSTEFNNLITKYNIIMDPSVVQKIISLLQFLSNNTNDNIPLKTIINEVLLIAKDNKIDARDIPIFVQIITECMKLNINKSTLASINIDEIGFLIKIIIVSLIETKIININTENELLISKLIDSSIFLLKTSFEIEKIPTKCSCW